MRTKQVTMPYFIVISKGHFSSDSGHDSIPDISMGSSISLQRAWSISDLNLPEKDAKLARLEGNDLNSNVNIRQTSVVVPAAKKTYENIITHKLVRNAAEGRQ